MPAPELGYRSPVGLCLRANWLFAYLPAT